MYRFTLDHVCAASGARAATIETDHGTVQTPLFMPVGTQAAIKAAVRPRDLQEMGAGIILSNTYHLMLRPGAERIRDAGGLHRFMGWQGPILTDSGGFQVLSLSRWRKISDAGVQFQSHIDGTRFQLDAEEAIRLQEAFGSDIAMALDECPKAVAPTADLERAMARTTAWLDRCIAARRRPEAVALYGIVQGGANTELRARHVDEICARDACEGFAIGGLSVGESTERMVEVSAFTAARMPTDKARYLMGVGKPMDLLHCIAGGVDQFDCVLPSRNARHGKLLTRDGGLNIKNSRFTADDRPIDPDCDCATCTRFSRSYLRHLFMAGEALGGCLMTIHNLHFYLWLSRTARAAILADRYDVWSGQLLERMATGRWKAAASQNAVQAPGETLPGEA